MREKNTSQHNTSHTTRIVRAHLRTFDLDFPTTQPTLSSVSRASHHDDDGMPSDDDAIAAYTRLAVAAALAFALTSAREEVAVWTATARLQLRALTRDFVHELGLIRSSAETRLIAIAGGVVGALALSKPDEKSFDSWFDRYRAWVREEKANGAGDAAGGFVARAKRRYIEASDAVLTYGGISTRGKVKKTSSRDWFVARTVVVGDSVVFVGLGGLWWGPACSFNAAKRAVNDGLAFLARLKETLT